MRRQSIFSKTLIMAAVSLVASDVATKAHAEPAIHLVVVGDTLDPRIGGSVEVDMQSIAGTFAGQVRKGDRLEIVTLKSGECRPDLILRRIAALGAGPDDAVVVFFSGHGAFDDQEDQYLKFPRLGPQFFLTRRQVREAIKAKGTRLGVLITDCCNNISIIPKLPSALRWAPMAPAPPLISPLFRSLFLETRGLVDVTSSKKGERSLAYPATKFAGREEVYPQGGLFSTSIVRVRERVARERAGEVRAAAAQLRLERVRALDVQLFEVLVVLRRREVETGARADPAALDRVLVRLREGDEVAVDDALREVEARRPAHRLERRLARSLERLDERRAARAGSARGRSRRPAR